MTMTKHEFKDLAELIAVLFPKEKIVFTRPMADAWYEALKDLEYESAKEGILKYAQNNQWFPSIADIRKNAPQTFHDVTEEEGYKEFMQRFGDRYREMDKW